MIPIKDQVLKFVSRPGTSVLHFPDLKPVRELDDIKDKFGMNLVVIPNESMFGVFQGASTGQDVKYGKSGTHIELKGGEQYVYTYDVKKGLVICQDIRVNGYEKIIPKNGIYEKMVEQKGVYFID